MTSTAHWWPILWWSSTYPFSMMFTCLLFVTIMTIMMLMVLVSLSLITAPADLSISTVARRWVGDQWRRGVGGVTTASALVFTMAARAWPWRWATVRGATRARPWVWSTALAPRFSSFVKGLIRLIHHHLTWFTLLILLSTSFLVLHCDCKYNRDFLFKNWCKIL